MTTPEGRGHATWRARDAMRRHDLLAAGIFSGILGGVVMIAVVTFAAANQGIAPLHPLETIGETFVGPEALDAGAKAAFGALVHALTAAALGIVFAAVAPRELAPWSAMGLGVGFALLGMGLMMTFAVPSVNPGLREGMQAIGGSWVIADGLFGAALGLAPALRRRLSRAAAEPPLSVLAAPVPGAHPAAGKARTT